MIFKTYNSYLNWFIEKPLLLFPFTSPTESKLFLFKYVAYVDMNFGCYGCSKHPKKIRKHPKNIRKHLKTSEKHPKNIRTKNYVKTSKNIRKTYKKHPKTFKKHPKKIRKTSEKEWWDVFGMWYSFLHCIQYLCSFVQYYIIILFILLFLVSII